MRFVETPVFTTLIVRLVADEELRALQAALLLRPEQGVRIPRSGGLRKIRWAARGRGSRGGLRVVYYWSSAEDTVYLLYACAKGTAGDLSQAQLKVLRTLVKEELG